jgi:molecular chaperone HtpG
LPDWAFFVRCVIDTDALRPTASREALYEDDRLAAVRDALGSRLRDWLAGLAATDPARLNRLLAVHYLGVKALARFDDDLFALTLPWLPFETTAGRVPLTEFADRHRVIHLTAGDEEFQQVAPIAAAAGLGVVNGGYTYDAELVRKLPRALPGVTVADLDPDTVAAHLDAVDAADEPAAGPLLAVARRVLDPLDCDVALRAFHPLTIPALLLDGREARHERARADAETQAAAVTDDLWADILGALRTAGPRARLVLNHRSSLIQGLIELDDAELAGTGVEAVYGQALLLSKRPLRAAEAALLNRAFLGLLAHAVGRERESETGDEG